MHIMKKVVIFLISILFVNYCFAYYEENETFEKDDIDIEYGLISSFMTTTTEYSNEDVLDYSGDSFLSGKLNQIEMDSTSYQIGFFTGITFYKVFDVVINFEKSILFDKNDSLTDTYWLVSNRDRVSFNNTGNLETEYQKRDIFCRYTVIPIDSKKLSYSKAHLCLILGHVSNRWNFEGHDLVSNHFSTTGEVFLEYELEQKGFYYGVELDLFPISRIEISTKVKYSKNIDVIDELHYLAIESITTGNGKASYLQTDIDLSLTLVDKNNFKLIFGAIAGFISFDSEGNAEEIEDATIRRNIPHEVNLDSHKLIGYIKIKI